MTGQGTWTEDVVFGMMAGRKERRGFQGKRLTFAPRLLTFIIMGGEMVVRREGGKVCGPQIVEPWCQLAEGITVLSKGGVAGTRHQAMG